MTEDVRKRKVAEIETVAELPGLSSPCKME
jgi:hypothetical protein